MKLGVLNNSAKVSRRGVAFEVAGRRGTIFRFYMFLVGKEEAPNDCFLCNFTETYTSDIEEPR